MHSNHIYRPYHLGDATFVQASLAPWSLKGIMSKWCTAEDDYACEVGAAGCADRAGLIFELKQNLLYGA